MTLLRVDYNVLRFLVYLVCHAADVRALAIMMIKLGGIPLIVYDVVTSSALGSVDSRPPIDIRARWLRLVVAMRWSSLLLWSPMSRISWRASMLWYRT